MEEKSDMKSNPSNCEMETVRREYAIGRRFHKIALTTLALFLTTLALLFVFCLGFILNESRYRDRLDGIHFYPYDKHRLEYFYKRAEKEFCDKTGVPIESPEAKKYGAEIRKQGRPLAEVGPFCVFVAEDGSQFSVHEISSFMPLVQLESRRQSKELQLLSSLEKGRRFPRLNAIFRYSEDGIYKGGGFWVYGKDEMCKTSYFDTQGIGVFNVMRVYKNEERFTYHLNGLSWEREEEQLLDHQDGDGEQLVSPELENK
jgi:hypothetical protein